MRLNIMQALFDLSIGLLLKDCHRGDALTQAEVCRGSDQLPLEKKLGSTRRW
jgi:hypothetical protein